MSSKDENENEKEKKKEKENDKTVTIKESNDDLDEVIGKSKSFEE